MKKCESWGQAATVEVCLSDISSAVAAARAGCTSIELCVDRISAGGVTPSQGLISLVVKRVLEIDLDVKVHVLIRPRDGDFCYSEDEFAVMLHDIEAAKAAGAHGIVVGVLTRNREIDMNRMQIIRTASMPMLLTFHRAFDVLSIDNSEMTIEKALQQVIDTGCDRLLTSGMSSKACTEEGMACLRRISDFIRTRSECSLNIIAASGIDLQNCCSVLASGVDGIHAGSSVTVELHSENCNVNDFSLKHLVDENKVKELVAKCS